MIVIFSLALRAFMSIALNYGAWPQRVNVHSFALREFLYPFQALCIILPTLKYPHDAKIIF
jgi:hypothetical protein